MKGFRAILELIPKIKKVALTVKLLSEYYEQIASDLKTIWDDDAENDVIKLDDE